MMTARNDENTKPLSPRSAAGGRGVSGAALPIGVRLERASRTGVVVGQGCASGDDKSGSVRREALDLDFSTRLEMTTSYVRRFDVKR